MASAASKKSSTNSSQRKGQSVAVVSGFALVRTQPRKKPVQVPSKDSAAVLMAKVGRALKKPGIDKQVVFTDNRARVFSYSTYPVDPSKVVRESADGTKRIGRLVNGRFVAAKSVA
jgi:hypothetical protein